ncbi:MAG: hypothetical protein ABIR79_25380 [Candidatus Binatia bacterium]
MRILVLNGGTGTIKAALASIARGIVTIERRATVPRCGRPHGLERRARLRRNDAATGGLISAPGSRPVYLIPTDEESIIAGGVARWLEEPR